MQKHQPWLQAQFKTATEKTGMPKNVFQPLVWKEFRGGQELVNHPLTKAVGFTVPLPVEKHYSIGQQKVRTNSCLRRDERINL